MGRASASRRHHRDLVRVAGLCRGRVTTVAALAPDGLAIIPPTLHANQSGATYDGGSSRPSAHRFSIAPTRPTEFFFRRPSPLPVAMRPPIDDGAPWRQAPVPTFPARKAATPTGCRICLCGSRPVVPPPPAPVAHTIRLSHISEGDLVRKVQPTYPALARAARLQGTVVLQAVISKQGQSRIQSAGRLSHARAGGD